MSIYPTGTVTFLFTDIEGSTKLAREHPDQWETLRQRHHSILQSAVNAQQGYVFQIIGDAFCAAFNTAGEALQAAGKAQNGLYAENWGNAPIKVRMGIHTGRADLQDSGEYHGYLTLSRVQRLMSAGCGGQTLLSQATQELVRDELPENVSLRDLGEHRLKDLIRSEHIYQFNLDGLPGDFPPIKTLDMYRHNLPVQMTSFIGRGQEMTEIKQALAQHHLVTLTGAGGAGKTRLSLQVAADVIDEFSDGVWFVDLAPVSDPAFVPQGIAAALNVREEGASPLMDLLVHYVQRRKMLIVLDNCEHLVEASAHAADILLHAASQLKIIATSREGLGIAGEKTFPVPSLSFSNASHPSASTLSQYEATRLFIDRALLVQPHFAVTNENAPAVAQICHWLDGIPLAIELAAARVKAMSPEQIAARLGDSFRLLTGGSRTALPRQQTLRAMIDWSWELLSEEERLLLRRLSVFAGGWTLEAAEGICAGEGIDAFDILDLLTQLVGKSLVLWHEAAAEPRYQLLETIRQYAHARLSEANGAGEEARLSQCHAEFFAQFAEEAESQLFSPATAAWLKRLDTEQDNLHAALECTVYSRSRTALRIIKANAKYLFLRNAFTEGFQWGERALNANPDAPMELRAPVLMWTGEFADQIGRKDLADQYGQAGLDLARQGQDQALRAEALFIRGSIAMEGGDPQLTMACYEEALPLARLTQSPWVLPGVLMYLGLMLTGIGEFAQAEAYVQEGDEIAQRFYVPFWQAMGVWFSGHLAFLRNDIGKARRDLMLALQTARENQYHMFTAHIEEMLGRVQILDPDLAGARLSLTQSLAMLQDMALKPCLAHNLEGWARLALAQWEPQRAARLLGAIQAHMKTLGMNMIPIEQALYDQTLAAVQQQLTATDFQQEREAGEKLTVEQAFELALSL
jgi:predicted ATPase/class 3 adenylate cyclase